MTARTLFRVAWQFAGLEGETTALDLTWTETSSLLGGTSELEADIRLRLPVDARAAVFRDGHDESTATATLYYADSPVLAGRWQDVQMEDASIVRFALRSDDDDRSLIPSETDIARIEVDPEALDRRLAEFNMQRLGNVVRVITDAFTAASRKAEGRIVPMVFGTPGNDDYPGSPGLIVDTTSTPKKLAIHTARVDTEDATIWGPPPDSEGDPDLQRQDSEPCSLDVTVDDLGRTIAVSDFGASGSNVIYDAEGDYFISWTDGEALPGGAGDICIMLLAASTLRWDVSAWEAVRVWLNGYRLAGYVDEAVSPYEVLARQVLPLLPLEAVPGPRGLRPAMYPWVVFPGLSGRDLVVGPGFTLASAVQRLGLEPTPSVQLSYGWDPSTRKQVYEVQAGEGRPEVIETRWVWDHGTADRIARERVLAAGDVPYVAEYTCDPTRYGIGGPEELNVGDALRFTDDRISVSGAQGVVGAVERTLHTMRVSIYFRL